MRASRTVPQRPTSQRTGLGDPDQVYAVAETERYKGTPEVVGFARMQRNRPQMRMTALATHLLSGGDAPTEASAVDELKKMSWLARSTTLS